MLKELALITITVANLAQVESAWQQEFDYQVADRGKISTELADYWDAEATAGADYVIMQPANEAPVYVRFIADIGCEGLHTDDEHRLECNGTTGARHGTACRSYG